MLPWRTVCFLLDEIHSASNRQSHRGNLSYLTGHVVGEGVAVLLLTGRGIVGRSAFFADAYLMAYEKTTLTRIFFRNHKRSVISKGLAKIFKNGTAESGERLCR